MIKVQLQTSRASPSSSGSLADLTG